MQRVRWLWVAVLILVGVGFLLHSIAEANSLNRGVGQGNGPILHDWTPIHADSPTGQNEENEIQSGLRIAPSFGRIDSTTFYVIGFGFTPNESIACERISPNGQESKLDPYAASQAGALFLAYKIKRADADESAAGINQLICKGTMSGQEKSAAIGLLMELTP